MTGYSTPKAIAEQLAETSKVKGSLAILPMVLLGMPVGDIASKLTWPSFLLNNLLPVTVGVVFIGMAYYAIYLRETLSSRRFG